MTDVWPFLWGGTNYTMRFDYDVNGNEIYIGWAQPGTASSATGWRISRQSFDGSNNMTVLEWPTASTAFNFVWDSRGTYSYS